MNGLAQSESAYLLQHAHNPVNWWPWGAESLEAAAAQGQWILVSIGYSACHWCHVMERDIFEDAECADLMNAHFRNIKVDREERPDIDHAYMAASMALSGQGGWPLNVVCLPDGRPIWASTYLPKDRWLDALQNLINIRDRHAELPGPYAQKLVDALEDVARPKGPPVDGVWDPEAWPWNHAPDAWDLDYGGFRGAPKFPLPALWTALLMLAPVTAHEPGRQHSLRTLQAIFHSGSYDALRGGLFRYSTDAVWHLPHFEKMAYDNGLWLRWSATAFGITQDPLDKLAFESTAQWVLRDMHRSDGLFCAALDADTDTKEGSSYVWTNAELRTILGSKVASMVLTLLNDQGPSWEDSHVIHWHPQHGRPSADWLELLEELRPVALKRPLPFRDDKSVQAWNAWVVTGLLEGALRIPAWRDAALAAAEAHERVFFQKSGTYPHVAYLGKPAQGDAFLDDLAASLALCIAAAQVSLDPLWLQRGEALLDYADRHHWDGQAYLYAGNTQTEPAFLTHYDWEDDVLPSAQGQMARALVYFGHLRHHSRHLDRARRLLGLASSLAAVPTRSMSWWGLVSTMADDADHLLLPPGLKGPLPIPPHFWLWGPSETGISPFGQVCTQNTCTLVFNTEQELHAYLKSR